ncbi:LysR family transcriptional regulator [Paenibacillus glycinis]|uniref:LysR family transcriptional regulator n=1 Tax=Paenibacillus glycinis TaxID=2697035 RepID=A0ABW9XRS3_9BACL|nr:LysR family transcriptional regulator [Paenibacillus glycinis]NBD25032.1 LysR family transcriptional regulator [Paenibacillus glycinis]
MRIEWLESFQIVADSKSLTKASESLHISQPALSKQIRSLEDELGAKLLMRSSSGVTLTPSGQIVLERSRRIIRDINRIRREVTLSQDGGKLCLILGSWPSLAALYFPKLIASKQSNMKLEIKVRTFYYFNDIMTNLENGTLDGALFDDCGMKHPYYSTPAFTEEFFLFTSTQHPLYGNKKEVFFEEIKNETFVMVPEGYDIRMLVEKEFAIRGVKLNIALEIELGQGILGFIEASLGIAILPAIFLNHINETINAIRIPDFIVKRRIAIITREKAMGTLLGDFISPSNT